MTEPPPLIPPQNIRRIPENHEPEIFIPVPKFTADRLVRLGFLRRAEPKDDDPK